MNSHHNHHGHDHHKSQNNFSKILKNNKQWAKQCIEHEPNYFEKLVAVQKPKYLWIGCADSRVPANQIVKLGPGQLFVHRNIANIVPPSDSSSSAVIQYAVQHLKVQDIIVCGHSNCGGIKAAFKHQDFGSLQSWLCHLRQLRRKYRQHLKGSQEQQQKTLIELNVKQQVVNVSRNSSVQKAWLRGQNLQIHGVLYNLNNGILQDLGITINKIDHVPQQYKLTKISKTIQRQIKFNHHGNIKDNYEIKQGKQNKQFKQHDLNQQNKQIKISGD